MLNDFVDVESRDSNAIMKSVEQLRYLYGHEHERE